MNKKIKKDILLFFLAVISFFLLVYISLWTWKTPSCNVLDALGIPKTKFIPCVDIQM